MIKESIGTFAPSKWSSTLSTLDSEQASSLMDEDLVGLSSMDIIENLQSNIQQLDNLYGQLSFVLREIRYVMKV